MIFICTGHRPLEGAHRLLSTRNSRLKGVRPACLVVSENGYHCVSCLHLIIFRDKAKLRDEPFALSASSPTRAS